VFAINVQSVIFVLHRCRSTTHVKKFLSASIPQRTWQKVWIRIFWKSHAANVAFSFLNMYVKCLVQR